MKIEFITIDDAKGIYKEQAIITHDDGSVTAMPKSIYNEMQMQQLELNSMIEEGIEEDNE
jgi:hypothetical protein